MTISGKSILITLLLISSNIFGQNSWFVDNTNGNDSNSGTSVGSAVKTVDYLLLSNKVKPRDTVFIIGQYNNPSYDPNFVYGGNSDRNNPHIWHKENTIRINGLNGSPNKYITFKPYDANTVLKGDGANIVRITNSSYLRIEGFEIYGEGDHIPLSSAEGLITDGMQFLYLDANTVDEKHPTLNEVKFRVTVGTTIAQIAAATYPIIGSITRPSYIDTRGVYVSGCDHIELVNMEIHHTCGGGLRVSESSYVNIEGNDIHNCSMRSYSGTHALVVTKSKLGTANATDDPIYSITIQRNKVHHNYNEIFSWVGTKSFITPRIDEGKGISLQRNNLTTWKNGNKRIKVVNNVCYWNGFSGVHSNDGYHIDFINNTCYMNSYTNTVTYASQTQQGANIGISTQGGKDIRIANNISVVDTDWGGNAISSANTINLVVTDNIIFGINGIVNQDPDVVAVDVNTMVADPRFKNPSSFDFNLKVNSPAIDIANTAYAPSTDYFNKTRDSHPDLGAIEYDPTASVTNIDNANMRVYPNPCTDFIVIENAIDSTDEIRIYNVLGMELSKLVSIKESGNKMIVNTANLPNGIYILQNKEFKYKIIKK